MQKMGNPRWKIIQWNQDQIIPLMDIKIFLRNKPIVMTIHKSVQEYYIEPIYCLGFGA